MGMVRDVALLCPPAASPPPLRLALPASGADWAMLVAIGLFFGGLAFVVWRTRQRRTALLVVVGAAALCAVGSWLLANAVYDPWFAQTTTWENAQLHLRAGNCFAQYQAISTSIQATQMWLDQAINTLALAALAILLIPGSILLSWPQAQAADNPVRAKTV